MCATRRLESKSSLLDRRLARLESELRSLERRRSIEARYNANQLTVLPSLWLVNADIVDAHLGREDEVLKVDKAKVLRHAAGNQNK